MAGSGIVVLGIFVADMAFRAERPPRIGETILGSGFLLGPGGKGSNQSVGIARAGGDVTFISRLGNDTFGNMAREIWSDAGNVRYRIPTQFICLNQSISQSVNQVS